MAIIEVLDKYHHKIDILRKYTFSQYRVDFRGLGEMKVLVEITKENLYLLDTKEQYYLLFDGKWLAKVAKIEKSSDTEFENTLTITGKMANTIFEQRIVKGTLNFSGKSYKLVEALVSNNFSEEQEDKRRSLPIVIGYDDQNALDAKCRTIKKQYTGGYVWEDMEEILEQDKIGITMIPRVITEEVDALHGNLTNIKKWDLMIRAGVDRTKGNISGVPAIVISQSLSNIARTDYMHDVTNYKGMCYIAGEGEGGDRKWFEGFQNQQEEQAVGWDRTELWIDARDIQSETEDGGSISDEEYAELIQQRISEKFAECEKLEEYSATMTERVEQYKLGKDYDLGDTITVIDDELGIEVDAQIISITRSLQNSREIVDVGLAYGTIRRDPIRRIQEIRNTTAGNSTSISYLEKEVKTLRRMIEEGGQTGKKTKLDPCVVLDSAAGANSVSFKWSDPEDVTNEDGSTLVWAGTMVRRKKGSAVSGHEDGVLVVDVDERDKYKDAAYVDEGLEGGETYYYALFPYTTTGVYTESSKSTFSAEPYDVSDVTLAGCSNIQYRHTATSVFIKWEDPADKQSAVWAGTQLRRRLGSPVSDQNSGILLGNFTTRDSHKVQEYADSMLVEGETYYYGLFPYTTDGVYTNVDSGKFSVELVTMDLELDNCTNIRHAPGIGSISVSWTDPSNKQDSDGNKGIWAGTQLRRKIGSYPTDQNDGTLVIDSKTRDAYMTSAYTDSGLVGGQTYYYGLFPYTTRGTYTVNTKNFFSDTAGSKTQVAVGACTGLSSVVEDGKIVIKWTDPADVETNTTEGTWIGTMLRRSETASPTSQSDGDLIVDSKVRDQYSTSGYVDENVEEGKTYYYALIPYTSTYYTTDESNRFSVTVSAALPYDPVLENNTWAQIQEAARAGVAKDIWSIGDEKKISFLQGQECTMQIADFDHDKENSITFVTKEVICYTLSGTIPGVGTISVTVPYTTWYIANDEYGWGRLSQLIVGGFSDVVVQVQKKVVGRQSGSQTRDVMAWSPSANEIGMPNFYPSTQTERDGELYPLFENLGMNTNVNANSARIKVMYGKDTKANWPTRTFDDPTVSYGKYIWLVGTNGAVTRKSASYNQSSVSDGFCWMFCVG